MRIFLVPFQELDDQRVLGQHREIHMAWSLIVKQGQRWGKITDEIGYWSDVKNRYRLWDVHERTVAEMAARGFNGHQTPIEAPDDGKAYTNWNVAIPRELVQRDRWHLWLRWNGVFRGREMADPTAWAEIEKRWEAQGRVCLHNETWERLDVGYRFIDGDESQPAYGATYLCLLCKRKERFEPWSKAPTTSPMGTTPSGSFTITDGH